jgi:DNA replication protein DnaC
MGTQAELKELVAKRSDYANPPAPNDYLDDEGFRMRGNYKTRKQIEVNWLDDKLRKVGTPCHCRSEQIKIEKAEDERRKFQQYVEELRKDGLSDAEYFKRTFAVDDQQDPELSEYCREYVDDWENKKRENVGILFSGDQSTGKSFFACCIANALLDRQITACVTSFPIIHMKLAQSFDDPEVLNSLNRYSLLVIDDFGVERDTPTALERTYSIIEKRLNSGKPLIITTNLSPDDFKNPANIAYARIYDRVKQNCMPIKMIGESRRVEIAKAKFEKHGFHRR